MSCSDPFILRNIRSFNYSACDSFLVKAFLSRTSVGGTGRPPELLLLPLEMKLCSISRAISREVTLVSPGRKDVSTPPMPVAPGVKGMVPGVSPPRLGKDRQNNPSFILVRSSLPLKYCPPSRAHMARTSAPGCQTKGACAPGMFYSCSALKHKQGRLFCRPDWRSPAFVLRGCRDGIAKRGWRGNCKEGPESSPLRGTCCSAAGAPPPQDYSERVQHQKSQLLFRFC